ncbi:hypothetical protein [Methanoculleus chikugoensis]|uniref:hypothetical protein n=1 Tax=Methanoculleus chikugoensis TaxID=118126 RepID=UPI001FB35D12|nr:hypothetical protein [Methanoculleus chikugoensis]
MMEIRAVNLQTGDHGRPRVPAARDGPPRGFCDEEGEHHGAERLRLRDPHPARRGRRGLRDQHRPDHPGTPPPQVILADGAVLDSTRSTSPVALPVSDPPGPPDPPGKAVLRAGRAVQGAEQRCADATYAPGFEAALAAAGLFGAGIAVLARRRR